MRLKRARRERIAGTWETRAVRRGGRRPFRRARGRPARPAPIRNRKLAPLLLSNGRSQKPLSLPCDDAEDDSLPFSSSASGARHSRAALLRCGRGRGRRRRARSNFEPRRSITRSRGYPARPLPSAPARPRPGRPRRHRRSAAPVTFGTPPILWKARPGAARSALVGTCHEAMLERDLVLAESPNALAISRLPAGSSEPWMKSRIRSRVGKAGSLGTLRH